jgi:5-methylcytosine-specific restriction endonuclease McrA
MAKVLVLNASYEPLNITSWQRAAVLVLKGKAEQIEQNHERRIAHNFNLPTVVRLRHYVSVPYKEIPLTRRNVLHRDAHTCQYCGSKEELTIDHVIPRSRKGVESWENFVTACVRCNIKKGNRTPQEAGMPLLKKPSRPHSSLYFEVSKHLKSGSNEEWRKYIIGLS